jgi:membrane protease YdiL (CAAX protease family)
MPDQPSASAQLALSLELALAAIGALIAWRIVFSPAARARRKPSPLAAWDLNPFELLLFFLHVFFGATIASLTAALAAKPLGLAGDNLMILSNGVAQLGLLAGVGLFSATHPGRFQAIVGAPSQILVTGFATFLVSVPIVLLAGLISAGVMKGAGLPLDKQLAVDLFGRTVSLPWRMTLGIVAVIVAPIAEELIFRAGLFRYCRTRLPRWAALVFPACVFAAMHNNLPTFLQLAVLGIVFSLAYERTGTIGTAIVAHALFNFHQVLLLLAGVTS